MKHKTLSVFSILLAVSLVLVACGQPAAAPTATPQPPTAAPAAEKVTITLATWAGADESKELQGVIDKVNATATDFQIVHQAIPADYYTKVQTMIAGNTAPDLMWLSQEYVANYADNGAII